jgi:hypothetical protein
MAEAWIDERRHKAWTAGQKKVGDRKQFAKFPENGGRYQESRNKSEAGAA